MLSVLGPLQIVLTCADFADMPTSPAREILGEPFADKSVQLCRPPRGTVHLLVGSLSRRV